jgi:hypothetical protein
MKHHVFSRIKLEDGHFVSVETTIQNGFNAGDNEYLYFNPGDMSEINYYSEDAPDRTVLSDLELLAIFLSNTGVYIVDNFSRIRQGGAFLYHGYKLAPHLHATKENLITFYTNQGDNWLGNSHSEAGIKVVTLAKEGLELFPEENILKQMKIAGLTFQFNQYFANREYSEALQFYKEIYDSSEAEMQNLLDDKQISIFQKPLLHYASLGDLAKLQEIFPLIKENIESDDIYSTLYKETYLATWIYSIEKKDFQTARDCLVLLENEFPDDEDIEALEEEINLAIMYNQKLREK